MTWTIKRWWLAIGLATLALIALSLVISPNPLSPFLIPAGMALLGLAGPSILWGIERAADTSKAGINRGLGVVLSLFAFGIAKAGFDLAWAGVAVALAILETKLN